MGYIAMDVEAGERKPFTIVIVNRALCGPWLKPSPKNEERI